MNPLTDCEIDAVTDAQWGGGCMPNQYLAHRAFARAILAAQAAKEQPDSFHQAQPSGEPATALPADWKPTPHEPTKNMTTAGLEQWERDMGPNHVWMAMWHAAPGSQADNASPRSDHPLRIAGAAGELGDPDIQSHPMGGAILRGEAASNFLETIGAALPPARVYADGNGLPPSDGVTGLDISACDAAQQGEKQ